MPQLKLGRDDRRPHACGEQLLERPAGPYICPPVPGCLIPARQLARMQMRRQGAVAAELIGGGCATS